MFRFAKHREVLWPVTINLAADGGPQKVEIKVRYRLLTVSEVQNLSALFEGWTKEGETDPAGRLLRERVTGWDGIADDTTGEPLPFTADNLAAVLDLADVRVAVESALYDASRGAVAKN